MCDEKTFDRPSAPDRSHSSLTRRELGALSLAAGAAMLAPGAAQALDVTAVEIDVRTRDGVADCHFVHPIEGRHPGVLIWPDARGMRAVYRQMAGRLAAEGFAVLVVNPYYRGLRAPVLPEGASQTGPETMSTLRPLLATMSPQTHVTDSVALLEYLDAQPAVDTERKMGVMGYCLGGPITMRAAAAVPERVGACASFHGVQLVTEGPESPHLLVPRMRSAYLFAIAEDDDERDPQVKNVLRETFDRAGLPAEIEVYEGAMHSWCTADSPVHNPDQAERAWTRMRALFDAELS